eukprot:jgi/Mesvir1/9779/Mv12413-RA.1
MKHCKECMPSLVTGQLLGLDIGATLEVTNCFPFPSQGEDEDDAGESDGANYQLEMMRCLREVNVDNNTVGWYQSTYMGSFQTVELIETFLNYQENIKRCVCIIYDPLRSSQGVLAMKALRLTDKFMDLYRTQNFNYENISKSGMTYQNIFEEIPISIKNSALHAALMADMCSKSTATRCDLDRLSLSTNPFLEKNIEFVLECMDDLSLEQQKFAYYQRNLARQAQQQQQFLQKRRAENAQKRAHGEEVLPEEDPNNPIFKPIPEPSRLDAYLITNQISSYCGQISNFSSESLSKLCLMQSVRVSDH